MPWTKRIFFFESCFIPSASLGPPPDFVQGNQPHAILLAPKAIRVKTGSAVQPFMKCPMPCSPRSPYQGVCWSEQSDNGDSHCRCHMHRPVVVGDHQGSQFQHPGQFLEPGPSSQVPMDRLHV